MLHDAGEHDVPDLAAAEDSRHLVFVPLGGSSLDLWISRLEEFNRPEFYVFDRDNAPPADPHYAAQADEINQRDNCTVWHTGKRELENYIHKDVIVEDWAAYSGTNTEFEDVPFLLAQAVHETSESDCEWAEVVDNQVKLKKKVSAAKKRLNSHMAKRVTPELLTSVDPNDDVRTWLRAIGATL